MQVDGRSIFGYFPTREEAQGAMEQLSQAGFNDVQLDSVSRTSQKGRTRQVGNPLTGDIDSLSALTMGAATEEFGDDMGILLSADTSASGYGGGAAPQELGWLVVALSDGTNQQTERAVKIMKTHGGTV